MWSTEQLLAYSRWSGYLTIFVAVLMIVGWVLKWGIRFRLVGVTGFMTVLTAGLFALSLSLYTRPTIPDAVRFSRVYDTGGVDLVVAVAPDINETQLAATMEQAALDLYSLGRLTKGPDQLTIRFRTVLHPEPGLSKLVYLGEVKRSLLSREDPQLQIKIDQKQLAQVMAAAA